jgi:hypothetical protein
MLSSPKLLTFLSDGLFVIVDLHSSAQVEEPVHYS